MLPSSTMPHSRSMTHTQRHSRFAITGSTAVSVFSVKSCWRDRMTIRKPTE